MNTKATATGSASSATPILLTCGRGGKGNNFLAWRENCLDIFGPLFGSQANVLKNNIAYVPPTVVEADYMPFEDPNNGHGFNATAIATLKLEAEKPEERRSVSSKIWSPSSTARFGLQFRLSLES